MTYQVPPKVEWIIKKDETKIRRALLAGGWTHGGCSLQEILSGGITGGNKEPGDIVCLLLQPQGCYLERGTKKHPLVESPENCAVYQKAKELLYG